MKRKIFSGVFLLVSILIGLGAFGHASQWSKHIYPAIGGAISDQQIIRLLLSVWMFVSGCMIVFGVILIRIWFGMKKNIRGMLIVPISISVFYFIYGLLSWIWVDPFFALFVVLGALLFISSLVLNKDGAVG